jgi:hypothetical protein
MTDQQNSSDRNKKADGTGEMKNRQNSEKYDIIML